MSRPVISVENLCKAYRIGLKEEVPDTLMSAVASVARAPWKNLQRLRRLNTFSDDVAGPENDDTLWALKDVSFQVREGEVLGIIGRNGAGKSTLLKILSRITEPTSGRIRIKGRVSSLLEVGTGFHPELSGRENIYMNGTILGMTKAEIDRKFDEIVDFSGVEKFLDTPVKRYSSGMKVRLAFAVAAHLEPEILIIDEVLAVGDAEFQKKCLGKMQDVATGGRTVLFVSHNMGAVQSLCSTATVLSNGNVVNTGDVTAAIAAYMTSHSTLSSSDLDKREDRRGRGNVRLLKLTIEGSRDYKTIEPGEAIRLHFHTSHSTSKIRLAFTIYASDGLALFHLASDFCLAEYSSTTRSHVYTCVLPSPCFCPGTYYVNTQISSPDSLEDHVDTAASFTINEFASGNRRKGLSGHTSRMTIPFEWTTNTLN